MFIWGFFFLQSIQNYFDVAELVLKVISFSFISICM